MDLEHLDVKKYTLNKSVIFFFKFELKYKTVQSQLKNRLKKDWQVLINKTIDMLCFIMTWLYFSWLWAFITYTTIHGELSNNIQGVLISKFLTCLQYLLSEDLWILLVYLAYIWYIRPLLWSWPMLPWLPHLAPVTSVTIHVSVLVISDGVLHL